MASHALYLKLMAAFLLFTLLVSECASLQLRSNVVRQRRPYFVPSMTSASVGDFKPDYYKVLGVDKKAEPHEIKKAYYNLARVCHPDLNVDNPNSADAFCMLNEAYRVLGHPGRRANYDGGLSMGQILGIAKEIAVDIALPMVKDVAIPLITLAFLSSVKVLSNGLAYTKVLMGQASESAFKQPWAFPQIVWNPKEESRVEIPIPTQDSVAQDLGKESNVQEPVTPANITVQKSNQSMQRYSPSPTIRYYPVSRYFAKIAEIANKYGKNIGKSSKFDEESPQKRLQSPINQYFEHKH